jgi:hypothetical protein
MNPTRSLDGRGTNRYARLTAVGLVGRDQSSQLSRSCGRPWGRGRLKGDGWFPIRCQPLPQSLLSRHDCHRQQSQEPIKDLYFELLLGDVRGADAPIHNLSIDAGINMGAVAVSRFIVIPVSVLNIRLAAGLQGYLKISQLIFGSTGSVSAFPSRQFLLSVSIISWTFCPCSAYS